MKKNIKKYLSLVTIFTLLMTLLPLNISAETLKDKENFPTSNTYININNIGEINNSNIKINVREDVLSKVDQEELEQYVIDLVNENPDAENINIIDVYSPDDVNNTPSIENRIEASYRTSTTKSNVQKDVLLEKKFLFSLAKGQKRVINSTYTFNTSASGGYKNLAEITGKTSFSYRVTDTFYGPPESSKSNSREFEIKFYGEKGNYVQKMYERLGNKETLKKTYSGTYKSAKKALKYSIDRKI